MIKKGRFYQILWTTLLSWSLSFALYAQSPASGAGSNQTSFYPARFRLDEVTLLDSPFKRAQDLNFHFLMEYDVDRLLTPYVRQSGLSSTTDAKSPYYQWEFEHPAFNSFAWNPALAMDGHLLGHYLSALSLACSACHDEGTKAKLRERVDYIVRVLRDCQEVFDHNKDGLKGFIGGIPDNNIWKGLHDSSYRTYNERGHWTPFYCEHKVAAGLRDAYLYAGNAMAKTVFQKMCDWLIDIVSMFRDDVMEMQILQWEPGAINEVLADAYVIFGDPKYLKGAQKYSHQILIENMLNDERNVFLDKKPVNHFCAMFLGIARIDEVKRDTRYVKSAVRFWEDVVNHRATAIGGVGIGGHFLMRTQSLRRILDGDGPGLCPTYNLMKLSEMLFAEVPDARYAEYYERAMLNHVLGSQDPRTGGFTFFTPMRAESYRIYGKVNEAMWCCMGTGMESQSRYGEFIYSFANDTLYVNLFVPSELNSTRVSLVQETDFPYGNTSRIKIKKAGVYKIAVRHPAWATSGFSISVNGKPLKFKEDQIVEGRPSYVYCGRGWQQNDVIEVKYPMQVKAEPCPGLSDYVALTYGPTVLVAQTTDSMRGMPHYEYLANEYGGEGMHDFSPQTREKFPNPAFSPMLICEPSEIASRVKLVDKSRLVFSVDASAPASRWHQVKVTPFFSTHHVRYMVYWNQQTREAWLRNPMYVNQAKRMEQESLTVDCVTPGLSESEQQHNVHVSETGSRGTYNGQTFRDAQPGQWYEYTLKCPEGNETAQQGKKMQLVCRFAAIDRGRSLQLTVDGQEVETYTVTTKDIGQEKFFEKTFPLKNCMLQGKSEIVVRLSSVDNSYVPRCFMVRLMRQSEEK